MSNLRSLLDLMKESNQLKELKEIESHLENVTENLETVLSELITTLKIQNSDQFQPEPVNIEQSFDNVLRLLNGEIKSKQAEVQSNFSGANTVYFSKDFLETIFLHLLSNSLRYANPDRKLRISVESFPIGAQTTISFSDNGIGIDLERTETKFFSLGRLFIVISVGKGWGYF